MAKILKIYDNEGEAFDRYTVVIDECYNGKYECLALSDNANSPQGFSQWCNCMIGDHLGKEIAFNSLAPELQEHIKNRLEE